MIDFIYCKITDVPLLDFGFLGQSKKSGEYNFGPRTFKANVDDMGQIVPEFEAGLKNV